MIAFLQEWLAELAQAVGPIRPSDDPRPFWQRNIRLRPNAQSFSATLRIYHGVRAEKVVRDETV